MVPVSALLKEYGEDITSDEVLLRASVRLMPLGEGGQQEINLL